MTLEEDASAESSGMSGSVMWTAFLGKEQDIHKHGVIESRRTQREGAQEPQIPKSAVLGGGFC